MFPQQTNWLAVIIGVAALLLTCAVSIRVLFRNYPDDRFIQCAGSTVVVYAMMIAAVRLSIFPGWIVAIISVVLYLLTFSSIVIGIQQLYHAARRRKAR
jgi:hypothetical protein